MAIRTGILRTWEAELILGHQASSLVQAQFLGRHGFEREDVPSTPSKERTTGVRTFMIADVRGYSRFTAEQGDAAAAQLAQTFASLARDAVEARGGAVIELRGTKHSPSSM